MHSVRSKKGLVRAVCLNLVLKKKSTVLDRVKIGKKERKGRKERRKGRKRKEGKKRKKGKKRKEGRKYWEKHR